jgi:hydrogenase expression/formation protein HypE
LATEPDDRGGPDSDHVHHRGQGREARRPQRHHRPGALHKSPSTICTTLSQARAELLADVITPELGITGPLEDAALIGLDQVFSTDSYVVTPRFFPGGDIGSLAVHGTVNDLAMRGARPTALSLAYIIEEGLPISELRSITRSAAAAARAAGVPIVTGDTKVVGRGAADGIYITTTGVGRAVARRLAVRGKCRSR